MDWKMFALSLSWNIFMSFSPVRSFIFLMPRNSRLTQCRAMAAQDWSVSDWQLEISKFIKVAPACLVIWKKVGGKTLYPLLLV